MPAENASYVLRVCGVAIRDNKSGEQPTVLVIQLKDQAKEREAARLPATSSVKIVALPGGNTLTTDASFKEGFLRSVKAQIGCDAVMTGIWFGPYEHNSQTMRRLTLGSRMKLIGNPKTTDQVLGFHWVTLADLESEIKVRFPESGNRSSMFKVAEACLKQTTGQKPAHETDEIVLK